MKQYKIIFCDLDGTLIETISGEVYPKGVWDMKIKFDVIDKIEQLKPLALFILTNQEIIGEGYINNKRNFEYKMEYLIRSIREYTGLLVEYNYCCSNDRNCRYRKPNTGMYDNFMKKVREKWFAHENINISEDVLVIGGAEDRKMSENIGCDYIHVEELLKL